MYINKIVTSGVVAVTLFAATIASAQTYLAPINSAPAYYGPCVNLTTDLSFNSTGSQVRQLQTFLVSRNYRGGGTWMITSTFHTGTLTALRNFQTEQNLPVTGVADAATRAAIVRVTCGGTGFNF